MSILNVEMNALLLRAARRLGVDAPILAARLVGNRLELHLYGGRVVEYPLAAPEGEGQTRDLTMPGLYVLPLVELRRVAEARGVSLRGARSKAEVIQRLLRSAALVEEQP